MDEKSGKWVTVSGAHVFIKDGQSLEDALKGSGEHRQNANYADILGQDKETRLDDVDFYTGEPKREQRERQDADVSDGEVRDRKPNVTPNQVANAKNLLKENGYSERDFMDKVNQADVNGYATLDMKTGKPVEFTDGYMVSFQVNKAVGVHRDYTPEEYDNYVYECITRTGSLPYLGTYGNAEISFHAKDEKTALKIAEDFNQASIYNVKSGDIIMNPKYNRKTNPTED